jgi:DnaK suppressor protein
MALTQQQTQELQKTIEQRRHSLMQELREDLQRVRSDNLEELAGAAPDAGDESVATLIGDLHRADLDRDVTELEGLGEIAIERLRVNPAAVRCVECQRVHEKTHSGTASSSL